MKVMHLTASPFYGGPERVILDIVRTQSEPEFGIESTVVSFRENGGCMPLMEELEKEARRGRTRRGIVLPHDMPHLVAATFDLVRLLKSEKTDLLCAHGHKSRLLGWIAARRVGIPIVGVSHGWTWQDWKTSMYESLDRWVHRRMDRVVCVSEGQAKKVERAGTPRGRIVVIHNAVDPSRFAGPFDPEYRERLEAFFTTPPKRIVGAAGRLSPEKGYDVLIDAVGILSEKRRDDSTGYVLFGDGALRESLQKRIGESGIGDRFKLAGFTSELDRFLPHFDLFVQSSRTEGFPCVNLESMAAGIPVAATSVGGVPEQIRNGENGLLVAPDDPDALADAMRRLLDDDVLRRRLGERGREIVFTEFSCRKQAREYAELFRTLMPEKRNKAGADAPASLVK